MTVRRGLRRIAPPLTIWARRLARRSPEDPPQQRQPDDRADQDQDDQAGVVFEEAELDPEGAADREEEVEVEGDVEDREGDLLDDQAREHHREGRPGDQRREHQQHHPGAEVRRQEAVEGDGDGVAGEDEPVGDPGAGEGGAQDPEPGQRRQRGLRRLQRHPGDDRPGRDVADLAEEVADPIPGGHAEQVEDEDEEGDAADPDRDPRQAAGQRLGSVGPVPLAGDGVHAATLTDAGAPPGSVTVQR